VIKNKSAKIARLEPLADGQIWRMAETSLQVDMVGKLLVHYKLGKHNAVRVSNSIGSQTDIVKFLKKNKAVLVQRSKPVALKPAIPAKKTSARKPVVAKKKALAGK
jgi:hypothetical protein